MELLTSNAGGARVMAGGTDLLVDLRQGKKQAQVLVDITHIIGLDQIVVRNEWVEVGAAVTFAAIKNFVYFKKNVPMLAEAAASVGAEAIQNSATWVGNLVQAMPAADGAIVALALEADVSVYRQGKSCWRPVTTLFAGPGISTIDSSREIITQLRFKIPGTDWGTAWQRVGRRTALTLPTINCAVKLELEKECIRNAVVSLGPVATIPFRSKAAEAFLAEKPSTLETFDTAGKIAQGEADPRSNPLRASREYRLAIIPVLVRRALVTAYNRARRI
jgi:CO/xanthine dehydrogenase FAD-binding subunit